MEPIVGSVLHFTPAVGSGWLAQLTNEEGKTWNEPILGWGVVVVWAAYAKDNEDEETKGTSQFQTEVQPICLAEDGSIEPLLFRAGVELQGVTRIGV
jgi:hypothetical protein